jgi:hypothetical protein
MTTTGTTWARQAGTAVAIGGLAGVLVAGPVRAQQAEGQPPRANPFACMGEGESLVRGNSTAEIEAEVKKRVDNPPGADEGPVDVARHHCVTAELMRRVGDTRAAAYYEKAIASDPREPGLELWYGHYLRNVRGPRAPLTQEAELHHFRAVEKMEKVRAEGAEQQFDDITESWVRRGLMNLYQEDGLPLLRAKAFPYARGGAGKLGAALTTMLRASRDTGELGAVDDARRYASEAAFAGSPQRLARPLDDAELRGLIRTPLRFSIYNRLRLRVPWVGAFDFSHEHFRAPESQIGAFTEPNSFTNVRVDSFAVAWKRSIDLYPVLDLLLDLGYRRVQRTGVVEWYAQLQEGVNLFEVRPAVSRFLGPDKLTAGMNYIYMQIPTVPGGPLADRVRARAIRAFYVDYAVYRQLLLPDPSTWEIKRTATRGLHVYGGYALDDEAFGVRVAYRRDAYGGISLRGVGAFDLTVQGTVFSSDTTEDKKDLGNRTERVLDASQTIRQWRPTFIGLYRLVDEEAIPAVPKSPLAGLNLVIPVRADFAYQGTDKFDNLRGGAELWSKLVSTELRGTSFLVTAGYEAQWFHRLQKVIHMGRLELRMGWGML